MTNDKVSVAQLLKNEHHDDSQHHFIFAAPHPDNDMVLLRFNIALPKIGIDQVPDGMFIDVDLTDLYPSRIKRIDVIN